MKRIISAQPDYSPLLFNVIVRLALVALAMSTVTFATGLASNEDKPPAIGEVLEDYLALAHRAARTGDLSELREVMADSAVVDSRLYTVTGRDKIIDRLDFFLKRFGITNVKLLRPTVIDRDSLATVSGVMEYTVDVWGLPEYNGTQYYKSEWRRDPDSVWRVYLIKEIDPPRSK